MHSNRIIHRVIKNTRKNIIAGTSRGKYLASLQKLCTCGLTTTTKVYPVAPFMLSQHWFPLKPAFSHSRTLSTTAPTENSNEKEKELLSAEIIRSIKAELIEADVNSDGKVDAEELKLILKKHSDIFSEQDILEIGELFYTGRGGASVTHEQFMEAIANAAESNLDVEGGVTHRRTTKTDHPLGLGNCATEFMYGKVRSVYTPEELDIKVTHVEPKTVIDKLALNAVKVVRVCFDLVSGWNYGEITQAKVLRRVIFLETVAAIPGFVAAMVRHFKSLRNFSRDGGMMNMFLDEANNERMHLLTFVRLRDPPYFLRYAVLVSQTFIGIGFFILYNISPNFCHRFVGYVEEEACHTYTTIIETIEKAPETSDMAAWRTEQAPSIARGYWHLGEEGTVLDLMYAVRADEAEHRDVNHLCSGIRDGQINPLYDPVAKFDQVLKKYVEDMMKKGKE